jgi:hypothetical protein
VDGGQTLTWQGKLAVLAGCTAIIDTHHVVIATMGERFVLYRLPRLTAQEREEQARRAAQTTGHEPTMRKELAAAVARLFAELNVPPEPLELDERDKKRLVALATLAASPRSPVERVSYVREIELVPEAEAPSRLSRTLLRLLSGMTATGVSRETAWDVLMKVALDCMPTVRREVFDVVLETTAGIATKEIAIRLGYPTTTTRRSLEDLTAHDVVIRQSGGKGRPDYWAVSVWARRQYETSQGSSSAKSSVKGA